MIKKLVTIAMGCILIGIAGVFYYGIDFENNLPSYEKKWEFNAGELQQLLINSNSNNIEIKFIKSSNQTNYVEVKGNIKEETIDALENIVISNGNLPIDFTSAPNFNFQFLNFNMLSSRQYITVALADQNILDSLQVSLSSGNVYLYDIEATQVETSLNSGNLSIKGLISERVVLKTGSGNMNLDHIQSNVQASVGSGNIRALNLDGPGAFNSKSGNITIIQSNVNTLDVEAGSGNVTITPASQFSGFYDLQANSGSVRAPESKRETTDVIKVRTRSGNIKVK